MVIRVLVSASCRRFKISKCNEWWVQQGCRCWIEFHHGYPFQWQCVVRWIKWPWSMWFARSLAARGPLQIAVQAAWGVRPHQTIPNILLSHVTFLFPCMVSHVSQLPGTWNTWSLWSWVWYLLGRSRRRRGGTAGGWSWVTVKHFGATRWKGVFKEFLITISSHQSWKKVKHQTHPNPRQLGAKKCPRDTSHARWHCRLPAFWCFQEDVPGDSVDVNPTEEPVELWLGAKRMSRGWNILTLDDTDDWIARVLILRITCLPGSSSYWKLLVYVHKLKRQKIHRLQESVWSKIVTGSSYSIASFSQVHQVPTLVAAPCNTSYPSSPLMLS